MTCTLTVRSPVLSTHGPVAEAAAWAMAMQAPHAGCRRESEMDSSLEQAKLPGWGLDSLAAARGLQRTVL